jgi:hypothetical protein
MGDNRFCLHRAVYLSLWPHSCLTTVPVICDCCYCYYNLGDHLRLEIMGQLTYSLTGLRFLPRVAVPRPTNKTRLLLVVRVHRSLGNSNCLNCFSKFGDPSKEQRFIVSASNLLSYLRICQRCGSNSGLSSIICHIFGIDWKPHDWYICAHVSCIWVFPTKLNLLLHLHANEYYLEGKELLAYLLCTFILCTLTWSIWVTGNLVYESDDVKRENSLVHRPECGDRYIQNWHWKLSRFDC